MGACGGSRFIFPAAQPEGLVFCCVRRTVACFLPYDLLLTSLPTRDCVTAQDQALLLQSNPFEYHP